MVRAAGGVTAGLPPPGAGIGGCRVGATGWGRDGVWARPSPSRSGPGRTAGDPSARHAAPDAATADGRSAVGSRTVHQLVQATPEFVELRRRQRRFVFPMTAVFLLWYLAYVLLACYAREIMAIRVADGINLGLVIGLLQFVSTFAISTAYVVYARHRLDPLAERLRARVEHADDAAGTTARIAVHLFDLGGEDGRHTGPAGDR
jgi:uncharacterized membrane protein (DUF485 family)